MNLIQSQLTIEDKKYMKKMLVFVSSAKEDVRFVYHKKSPHVAQQHTF